MYLFHLTIFLLSDLMLYSPVFYLCDFLEIHLPALPALYVGHVW